MIKKRLPASVAHHRAFLKDRERVREETSDAAWEACLDRSRRDHHGWPSCELCDRGASVDNLEPHHLEYGSGKRVQEERVENVMVACRRCHDAFHARPLNFVAKVVAWCRAHLYPLPHRKEYRDA